MRQVTSMAACGFLPRQPHALGSPVRLAARRAIEALEPRILFFTTIDTPPAFITNITVGDGGGDLQVSYQPTPNGVPDQLFNTNGVNDSVANSGIFIRTSDGIINGNPEAVVVDSHALVPDTSAGDSQTLVRDAYGRFVLTNRMHRGGSGAPFSVVQTYTYQPGRRYFRVDNTVTNTGTGALPFAFFFAGDLYPGSEPGTGGTDASGAVTSTDPKVLDTDGTPLRTLFQPADPANPPTFFKESFFDDIWNHIAGGTDFDNTVSAQSQDNGMGLEWANQSLAAGASKTYSYFVAFGSAAPVEPDRPTARLVPTFLRNASGETTFDFTVRYASTLRDPLDQSTVDNADVIVHTPAGDLPATLVRSTAANEDDETGLPASIVDATYRITSPGGLPNGSYQVLMQANQVATGQGATVAAGAIATPNGRSTITPAPLQVTPNADPNALAAALAPGSAGVTITSATLVSSQQDPSTGASSIGTFVNPGGVYNLGASGIVLSTGDVNADNGLSDVEDRGFFPSINYLAGATADQNQLLNPITGAGQTHHDPTELDLSFTVAAGVTDVFFNVVYGTREDPGVAHPDAFGLILNGTNLAKTGDGHLINVNNPAVADVSGVALTHVVAPNGNPVIPIDITASQLQPGTNTLKIIISDTGDGDTDSAVYIAALGMTQATPPVTIDPTFNPPTLPFVSEAVASSGGAFYVAGHAAGGGPPMVARILADGSLDPAFGTGGVAQAGTGSGAGAGAYAVLPLSDGSGVLVGGSDGTNMVVARLTPAGQLDTTFGAGGVATLGFAANALGQNDAAAYALAVDSQGRILAAGATRNTNPQEDASGSSHDFALARLLTNGMPDPAFGTNGLVTAGLDTASSDASRRVITDDKAGAIALTGGRIVIAGQSGFQVAVAEFDQTGQPVASFGTAGTRLADLTTNDQAVGLAAQGNNLLLTASVGDPRGSTTDFGLVRLDGQTGNPDPTFGNQGNGRTQQDLGGADDADSIVLLSDGGIFVTGTYALGVTSLGPDSVSSTAVALYDANGLPRALPQVGGSAVQTAPNAAHFDPVPLTATGSAAAVPGSASPFAVSLAQLRQGAVAAATPDGNVVVATGSQNRQNTKVRKITVNGPSSPGSSDPRAGRTMLGAFGVGNGATSRKFAATDADGTKVTFSLNAGVGTVYRLADGQLGVDVTGTSAASALKITGKGGNGRVNLQLLNVQGSLKTLAAKTTDVATAQVSGTTQQGVVYVGGTAGKVTFGVLTGSTLAASGTLASVSVASIAGGQVVSGAVLGTDGLFGTFDSGSGADTYVAGQITTFAAGSLANARIAAGANPGADGVFGTSDDTRAGAGALPTIRARSADTTTRFVVGSGGTGFVRAKLPGRVRDISADPRFITLS